MPDVIIPPWLRPVSPVDLQFVDDQTAVFQPRFGRNRMQRQKWSDPRWGVTLKFEGMRDYERAALRRVLLDARGRSGNIWWGPGLPQRGSFAAPEMYTNNDFSNGTTGWTAYSVSGGAPTLTASDRVIRLAPVAISGNYGILQAAATNVQYAPYVNRAFIYEGLMRGAALRVSRIDDTNLAIALLGTGVEQGLDSVAIVPTTTSALTGGVMAPNAGTGIPASVYYECAWLSLSRCALVDGGANTLLNSSALANATWSAATANVTRTDNTTTSPDGTTNAGTLDGTSSVTQNFSYVYTVSSGQADYFHSVAVKANSRSWALIGMSDFLVSGVEVSVNLTTGAISSPITGATWSNLRSASVSLGHGWWLVCIAARKTGTAAQVGNVVRVASAANTLATGTIYCWRPTMAEGSVFGRLVSTGAAAVTAGTAQTGSTIPLKGLPASTNGLLLAGDFVQVGSQLVQLTAPLNSNAAGQGTMVVAPAIISAADNTPVIINNPMGRFMLASDPQIMERYGTYTDAELELVESYS